MTRTPSLVMRRPASVARRIRIGAERAGERAASKRSWTALATLLTFCPPGPPARMKLSSISRSSSAMREVISIIRGLGELGEEVVALVVDDDEGREVDDLDAPHRLHAELGVLD